MHDEYSVCISGKQLLRWNDDFKNYKIPVREQKFYRNDSFYMDDDYFYIKIKSKQKKSILEKYMIYLYQGILHMLQILWPFIIVRQDQLLHILWE